MNKRLHIWGLGCLFMLLTMTAYAQPEVPVNEKAREYLSLGKKYLKFKKYKDAARTFEIARELPFNQLTTAAILYEGIAWFRMEEWAKAQKRFDQLITMYPRSKYTDDASYHQCLMMLEANGDDVRERGLNQLFEYSEKFEDPTLREQATNTAKYYVFHKFDVNFLNQYYIVAPEKHKMMVLEGIIYQLTKEDQGELVKERIEMHEATGGTSTRYMSRARLHFSGGTQDFTGALRIAIMLPFNLQLLDTATVVPEGSRLALELFEGMQLSMDSLAKQYDKPITAMVFDTKSDPELVTDQLRQLEEFVPHFIVGDVRNKVSRPIASWAEQMGIVQMVPLSPSLSLVKDREHIFLSHPSVERHAASIAEFAFNKRNHRDFVVFNDGTKYPAIQATAFTNRLEELGGRVVREVTIPTGALSKERVTQIATELNRLKSLTFDAIYIPLSSEEHAGLIISRMNWIPIKTVGYGSPDWEHFGAIDPELMETFQMTISTPYHQFNDSLGLEHFKLYYWDNFNGGAPSKEVIEGYDIMNHLIMAVNKHNPLDPFSKTLEEAETFTGIHQNSSYTKQHDNQEVNIVQMIQNRWFKVNRPPAPENPFEGPNDGLISPERDDFNVNQGKPDQGND